MDYSDAYREAPARPQAPAFPLIDEAQVRAVAFALKACGIGLGSASAAAAAGIIISEVQRYGYIVAPEATVVV